MGILDCLLYNARGWTWKLLYRPSGFRQKHAIMPDASSAIQTSDIEHRRDVTIPCPAPYHHIGCITDGQGISERIGCAYVYRYWTYSTRIASLALCLRCCVKLKETASAKFRQSCLLIAHYIRHHKCSLRGQCLCALWFCSENNMAIGRANFLNCVWRDMNAPVCHCSIGNRCIKERHP